MFSCKFAICSIAAASAVAIPTAGSSAAVLAQYTFPTSNTDDSAVQPSNAVASSFAIPGFSSGGTSNTRWDNSLGAGDTSNRHRLINVGSIASQSESQAVSNADYAQFTVTPGSGYELDLTQVRLSTYLGGNNLQGTNPDSVTLFFRTSVDNFASTVGDSITAVADAPANGTTWPSLTVPLGASFQDLQSAFTVRIYAYKLNGSDVQYLRLDSIQLTGDVVQIPEPASLSLLGLAAAGVMRRRR